MRDLVYVYIYIGRLPVYHVNATLVPAEPTMVNSIVRSCCLFSIQLFSFFSIIIIIIKYIIIIIIVALLLFYIYIIIIIIIIYYVLLYKRFHNKFFLTTMAKVKVYDAIYLLF